DRPRAGADVSPPRQHRHGAGAASRSAAARGSRSGEVRARATRARGHHDLIGLELAQTYHRLGSTVTVLERLPEVLPREDPEVGRFVRERLEHEGITIVTGFAAERVTCEASLKVVHGADGRRVAGNEIFVATGRRPNTRDAEPERAGVELA